LNGKATLLESCVAELPGPGAMLRNVYLGIALCALLFNFLFACITVQMPEWAVDNEPEDSTVVVRMSEPIAGRRVLFRPAFSPTFFATESVHRLVEAM